MDIFAYALAAITVLAPSPVYPPQIPFTSIVGRMELRSFVEYPSSPCTSDKSNAFLYASKLNGAFAISARSAALRTSTSS